MLIQSHLTQVFKFFLISLVLSACSTTRALKNQPYSINFIDEFTVPSKFEFEGKTFGGISGIDYRDGYLVMVNDSPSNPLIFKAKLNLSSFQKRELEFTSVIELKDDQFFEKNALDMESIRFDDGEYIISTEGNIDKGFSPRIFNVSSKGKYLEDYPLPDYFLPQGENSPRDNGVFEGLAMDLDADGFWFATELPLIRDGKAPKLYNTNSPVRLSYFNRSRNQITQQYAMDLDRITKVPLLPFAVNGLTEILQLNEHQFLILERSYSAGHKSHGNKVKLFLLDISKATDIKAITSLKDAPQNIEYAQKSLLFDFKSIREKLTDQVVDNLEGLCYGPTLKNGNKTLIIVSDDNFSSFGPQLNQVIILELIKNQ
ncbi:esterase-like activity of phytase family protein [Psychroflexus tropicus]|uniref:esterase-like activity of phytase family protein n=1 Tax=Psychroflexus tropicus TaxID=197345 RepID=UPI0003639098|nr:esterase-like activity of phytase family protein [Psychroflexus tropicus]